MQNKWILDVLVDLKSFAQQNGLPQLSDQLDMTRAIAAQELIQNGEGVSGDDRGSTREFGTPDRTARERV